MKNIWTFKLDDGEYVETQDRGYLCLHEFCCSMGYRRLINAPKEIDIGVSDEPVSGWWKASFYWKRRVSDELCPCIRIGRLDREMPDMYELLAAYEGPYIWYKVWEVYYE